MKILFLTPQIPFPPRQGTALRNYHLIEGLAQRHDVSLLSFRESDQSDEPAGWGPLAALCQRIETVPIGPRSNGRRLLDLLITCRPDMALRLWQQHFADRLAEWMRQEEPDIVHVEGIEMAPYIPVLESVPRRPLVVFDDHNAEYVLQKRAYQTDMSVPPRWPAAIYSFLQWIRLRRYEAEVCTRADRVIAVSATDKAALESLVPGLTVGVVPNCIDTQSYFPTAKAEKSLFTLLFTGKMDYRPNIDAALWFWREIWPKIQDESPGVTWGIVGKSPHSRLEPLQSDPNVTVVGEVREMPPYFHSALVYIIPLRMGGGTRFKLLEAMAAGTSVVSTTVGAEGVPVQSGRDCLLADDPSEFASAVLSLLRDGEMRARLEKSALALVREQFDWRTVTPRLEKIYQR